MARHAARSAPRFLLIDDDEHSAYALSKTVSELDKDIIVQWTGSTAVAEIWLDDMFEIAANERPELIIVDLKATSRATSDFIARIRVAAAALGIPFVAMAGSLERPIRETLIQKGAAAVFERSADRETYRREIQAIVDFSHRAREPQANSA